MLLFLNGQAQPPGYKSFSIEKENKKVKINTLFKNRHGYIYTGTNNGLYKFDGEKFTSIHFENTAYTDTVTALFQDKQQKIWVGFRSGRIANIINKKLRYFNPEEGSPQKEITSFLQDKDGNTWFSTNGEGIYFIKNNRLYLINEEDGLSDVNVNTMALADNGDVIAGTDQGINICSIKNGKKTIKLIGPRQGLPDYMVTAIIPAGKNEYWIGMQDKGFCLYNHTTQTITVPAATKNWEYGQVNTMLAEQHTLWIGTQDYGLVKYHPGSNHMDTLPQLSTAKNISTLIQDNQGNIWMTTTDNELIRTAGESLKLIAIPGAPDFNHIHAILSAKNGDIWLNDYNNDLQRIYVNNGIYTTQKIKIPGLTTTTDITSLYQDYFENIWIGTMGKGLFILDPHSYQIRPFTENSNFINASILSLSGRQNTIFASSLQGSMAVELLPQNKDFTQPYQFSNFDNTNTGTNYIYSIFKDSKDRTWFATDGNGLTMLNNKVFTYYNKKDQLKDNHIYSVTEDKNGGIWFSTATAGIYKFDGKTFRNYNVNDGLSDLNISVLKTDNAGNIIIIHKTGIDILNPVTGNISYLRSGLGIPQINIEDLGAVSQDSTGAILISTVKGILWYSFPENSLQQPSTILESVQLFLKDIDNDRPNHFNVDENNFTFNYTGLFYTDPEKVQYQYKLEGLDTAWVTTLDQSKNFPKLAPGTYTFRIRSSLNKNFLNASEANYHFVIKQAYYKTAWFRILAFIIFSGLLYMIIKAREKNINRLQKLNNEKIQFQFEVLRNQVNPHFLFNSFNNLIITIEENPTLAVTYVEQLSDFFRNIVNYREKEVIALAEELTVLKTYFYLQQQRLGDSIQMQVDIDETKANNFLIPPLTLQLLVENAIKHNAVSTKTPLLIHVFITEDTLSVSNNKISRSSVQPGTGMGLENIINRFTLLTNKSVQIINEANNFTVQLPLLKNNE
ncbi:MAG: two-component regulator propeller domain-containing protein [Ferruginibacter sp.]